MSQEQTATANPVEADLRIDAFEYARKYRELKALGERIEAAAKEGAGLHAMVFFDGLEHFQLYKPYSEDLLKVKSLECVDKQ